MEIIMKTNFFKLLTAALLTTGLNVTIITAASAAWAPQQLQNLNQAVDFAFTSKAKEKFRVIKHKWNFENKNDIKIQRTGNKVTATGKFTHYLAVVRDDVVNYTITLQDGKIVDVEVNYKDRGWSEAAGWAIKIGKEIYDIWKKAEETGSSKQEVIARINEVVDDELSNKYDGSVQSEAGVIVAKIAARLQEQELNL
jgi:hypothetical protein